jgi:hypothetical protein
MKKSELRDFISEEIGKLFDVKYTQNNNLRIWLSADKKTIYLDNISESERPQLIKNLIRELRKEFKSLVVVKGSDKFIKSDQVIILQNIDEGIIDENKLEEIFDRESV